MKYESGETFESMSLRYSMVLNLLNYSDIKVSTPKLTDGQLIDRLRKSAYSETTERLLILFSYGLIDEKLLRNLVLGKIIKCEDVIEAENLVLALEKAENKDYVEIDADMLDLNAFVNALKMCASTANSDMLSYVNFGEAYIISSSKHKHIVMHEGYCSPDRYLFEFASTFEGMTLKYMKSNDSILAADAEELMLLINEQSDDECVIFKDARVAAFVEQYIGKLFGRDYIEYTINNELPAEINDEKYLDYLKEKKLSFEFTEYTRKHKYFTSKYNHLDYDIIKTENGELISIKEDVNGVECLRIDASEVNGDDSIREIIMKILKKNVDTFPEEGSIMKTIYDGEEMAFAYSKGKYTEIDFNVFAVNLVDFERILALVKFFSEKHLIRMSGDNDVEVIVSKGGIDYREQNNISNDEFEVIKGVIREQLARKFALERKKTEGLRSMSQLKIEAETAKREEALAKAQAEEEKRLRLEEERAKRNGRKKQGEE